MRLRYWFRYNGNGFRISVSKISPVPLIRESISGNKQIFPYMYVCIYGFDRGMGRNKKWKESFE